MKRSIALAAALLLTLTACGTEQEPDLPAAEEPLAGTPEPLICRMTQYERSRTQKRPFSLLEDSTAREHSVTLLVQDADSMQAMLDSGTMTLSDEELADYLAAIEAMRESGECPPVGALIDGNYYYTGVTPTPETVDGPIDFINVSADGGDTQEYHFETPVEYFDWYEQDMRENACLYEISEEEIPLCRQLAELVFDAVRTGNYETAPLETLDSLTATGQLSYTNPLLDNRSKWEFDRAAVEAIAGQVDEYLVCDEEMDTNFLVHVTRPPHYDPAQTYPVFLLTDGVWRFGDHPALYQQMAEGKAADVLLVSLGYDYDRDGTAEWLRLHHLVEQRTELLRFLTDNLMPYLGEQYHIDYANSTLFGHSDGGVFAHYAMFQSDRYDNQPFGKYVIGSPAFWALLNDDLSDDPAACLTDYGYFDRSDTLAKKLFLCAGSQEDPDYADDYHGQPTTLEGVAALCQRLDAHGCDYEYKAYDSHHYQYIPAMLCEVLCKFYPAPAAG